MAASPPPPASEPSSDQSPDRPPPKRRELPPLAEGLATKRSTPTHPSPSRSTAPAPNPSPPPPPRPSGDSPAWSKFLIRFLGGAMFGPLLAITIGVVGGATTGHALLMILLVSGAIVGLLSAVGGKYFWSFLARCLRVLFLMR